MFARTMKALATSPARVWMMMNKGKHTGFPNPIARAKHVMKLYKQLPAAELAAVKAKAAKMKVPKNISREKRLAMRPKKQPNSYACFVRDYYWGFDGKTSQQKMKTLAKMFKDASKTGKMPKKPSKATIKANKELAAKRKAAKELAKRKALAKAAPKKAVKKSTKKAVKKAVKKAAKKSTKKSKKN